MAAQQQLYQPNEVDPNWYKPTPALQEFHATKVRTRALIGGRGTGKTTAVAVESLGHAWHNSSAKIYILRKTQDSNADTTQETFEQVFAKCGSGYADTGVSLFKKIEGGKCFRLPSRKAVELFNEWKRLNPRANKSETIQWLETVGNRYCSFLHFAGVPSAQYRASRFRGFECSLLIFVEADQLDKEDLMLGLACLRWKGSDPETCNEQGFIKDSGVILDSNPPGTQHYLCKMYEKAVADNDPNVKFWFLKTRDNKSNLPPGYVESLESAYADNPAMYKRMLLGQFCDAFDGNPVLFAFKENHHAFTDLGFPKGSYLIRGHDIGTTWSTVWSAYWADGPDEYFWDLAELFATQSDTERQCRSIIELTDRVFPFWQDRSICAGVIDWVDVAACQKKATGSSLHVFHTYNIFPGYQKIGLQESLAIYNRLLERKDRHGQHVYRIDKNACPKLYTASIGGYRYPQVGEAGYGSDEPLKGIAGGDFDCLADSSRYAKMGCLRIIKTEHQAAKGHVGQLAVKMTPNRPKRYY